MAEQRPILRPSDIRQAVTQWAAMGFSVTLDTRTGLLTVTPPGPSKPGDPFDQIDMAR